jgi:predicted ATP-grasp superfamily ATP-dependent carboligase
MQIFIYEFVTGGGWWGVDASHPPSGSLRREGGAMLSALAEDFARLPGIELVCLRDARLASDELPTAASRVDSAGEEQAAFCRQAAAADWTLVIAPEFGGSLLTRVRWAERAGARLLSPDSAFVELSADKHRCAERLLDAGVPAPRGQAWRSGQSLVDGLTFPLVAKPVDGAGSLDVRLIQSQHEFEMLDGAARVWRLEPFCAGLPASVSVLCGPSGPVVFPGSRQILSDDGQFRYLGGEVPLPGELCRRTERLARGAVAALPATRGYVGIDLVLGDAEDGSLDRVLEVNPRLTTSYIGLRQIARGNLAAGMLQAARGERAELSFGGRPIRFAPD